MNTEAFANRKVIWKGANPEGNEQFRIVDRDADKPHEGHNTKMPDNGPRYIAEQRKGHDSMGVDRWGHVEVGSRYAFGKTMLAAFIDSLVEL